MEQDKTRTVYRDIPAEEPVQDTELQEEHMIEEDPESPAEAGARSELQDAPEAAPEPEPVIHPEDQQFAALSEERRLRMRKQKIRRKRRTIFIAVLIFGVLLTMCGREIVRLKAENLELKRQHAQLEAERDRLRNG